MILDIVCFKSVLIHSDAYKSVPILIPNVNIWDPKMYKLWYIGSVLWKAWWWLNIDETCCHKNILCNTLLRLSEIYT